MNNSTDYSKEKLKYHIEFTNGIEHIFRRVTNTFNIVSEYLSFCFTPKAFSLSQIEQILIFPRTIFVTHIHVYEVTFPRHITTEFYPHDISVKVK